MEKSKNIAVKKFIKARDDRAFRSIFVDEKDHTLMEALLSTCLETKVKIVKYLKTELSTRTALEREKRLDVLVKADGKFINVELNNTSSEALNARNFNYFTAFYSENTIRGHEYDIETDYIHIDLSFGLGKKREIRSEYTMYDKNTKDVYIKNFKVIVYNMDRIMQIWYNKEEKEIEKYKYLLMLGLDKEELEKISKDDEVVMRLKDKLEMYNGEYDFLAPLSAEEDAIALENTLKKMYKKEGLEEGRKEGIKEGRKEGRKEGIKEGIEEGQLAEKKSIAKNMLKMNYDIETIINLTGLSNEEINELKADN